MKTKTRNYQKKKLIKKTITSTIASKEYLGINLTQEVKNIYTENYKRH